MDSDEIAQTIKDGRAIFPEEEQENVCYQDIFQVWADIDPKKIPAQCLTALLVIKMRLVAKYESLQQLGDEIEKAQARQVLLEQRPQLEALMDQVDTNNRLILPAMVQPRPMFQAIPQEEDMDTEYGSPFEAREIVLKAVNLIRRIPGSKEWLVRRYGAHPTYAHKLPPSWFY